MPDQPFTAAEQRALQEGDYVEVTRQVESGQPWGGLIRQTRIAMVTRAPYRYSESVWCVDVGGRMELLSQCRPVPTPPDKRRLWTEADERIWRESYA